MHPHEGRIITESPNTLVFFSPRRANSMGEILKAWVLGASTREVFQALLNTEGKNGHNNTPTNLDN